MAQRQFRSDDTDKWKHAFGGGSDASSYSVPANQSCAGTSGTKTITVTDATGFFNGQLVLIHQTRGTGAGNWELNKLISGAGTATFTMESNLTHTYTRSGNSQAQIIELKEYENLTTGSITAPSWDGSKGGIIAFLDKGTTTVNGTLNLDGLIGATGCGGYVAGGAGRGYIGGNGLGQTSYPAQAIQGESSTGAGTGSNSANGTGGGGGRITRADQSGGGGGGHSTSGGNGNVTGGSTIGVASLVTMYFGGAGGGGAKDADCGNSNRASGGGGGGGICVIISKNIVVTGDISIDGGTGGAGYAGGGGGGGAGGSCLLKCETATLGTNKITAAVSVGGENGGAGGAGRIHIDYSDAITGTTSPTINSTLDTTIKSLSSGAGQFLTNFM